MSEAHIVARDHLRSFIERIERLEAEKQTIADDIKDVYGEAKATGFDTKILRKVISIRKQDADERAEQEAILDTYLQALGMIQTDLFDEPEPETSPKLVATVATAMQTQSGRAALLTAVDIMIEREERQESDGGAIAAVKGNARLANADGVEPSPSEHIDPVTGEITEIASPAVTSDDTLSTENGSPRESGGSGANTGGDDVDGGAVRADPYDPEELEPSGPEAERATNSLEHARCDMISQSPHIAAEAVSERTATQSLVFMPCDAVVERPALVGSQMGMAVAGGSGQPEMNPALTGQFPGANVSGPERAGVTAGETAPSFLSKPPTPLRPHCQRPENCGGYGRTHCGTCLRAKEKEMA